MTRPVPRTLTRARNLAKARRYLLPSMRAEQEYREGLSGILDVLDEEDIDEADIEEAKRRTHALFLIVFFALVQHNTENARRELGSLAGTQGQIAALAVSAGEESAALVVTVLEELATGGISADMARARLILIATDQVLKTNDEINRIRHEAAGAETYSWLTMRDDRVRPTHVANDGKVFRYDTPPPLTGAPGHDVNCRCIAVGIVPE